MCSNVNFAVYFIRNFVNNVIHTVIYQSSSVRSERATGFEPVIPAWQAGVLPLALYPRYSIQPGGAPYAQLQAVLLLDPKHACHAGGSHIPDRHMPGDFQHRK